MKAHKQFIINFLLIKFSAKCWTGEAGKTFTPAHSLTQSLIHEKFSWEKAGKIENFLNENLIRDNTCICNDRWWKFQEEENFLASAIVTTIFIAGDDLQQQNSVGNVAKNFSPSNAIFGLIVSEKNFKFHRAQCPVGEHKWWKGIKW